MKPGLVDDYLSALLGGSGQASAVSALSAVPAAPPAPTNPDEISDDEFEALLDGLHGGKPPSGLSEAAPAPSASEISDDEFEALLDSLHRERPPGAVPAAAAAVAATDGVKAGAPGTSAANAPAEQETRERDWQGNERRAGRRSSRWLRLRVHQQDYAVELLKVQEVVLPVPVLAMRDTDPAIRGVMNLRGVVVPVLDLGIWLGLEEVQDSPQTRFVVLEQNGDSLALRVSAVLDVHAIADTRIEPPENTLADPGSAILRGVTRLNSQPVLLLDAAALLG